MRPFFLSILMLAGMPALADPMGLERVNALRDVQGLSTEEASAVLGVKPQTLKSRLHRGRLILREQLADFADGLAMRSAV